MHRHFPTTVLVALALSACSSDDGAKVEGDIAAIGDVNSDVIFPETSFGDGTTQGDAISGPDGVDDSSDPDGDTSGGPCNTFGCACSSNADCLDELCIEGPDGRVCSTPCVTECPGEDFACVPIVLGGSDPFNACVPNHPNLCKPCRVDGECKNELAPTATALCLPAPDPKDGSFCSSSCAAGTPCPDGYTCGDIPLAGGGTTKQCVPTDGTCECRPAWASMNLITDCQRGNASGTCGGERTCGLSGLTACDAPPPAAETCNGQDDDCNGASDDIEPVACTMENNGVGACSGTAGCANGEPVCNGVSAAAEACNLVDDDCDAATDEGTCGDGLVCTDDVCAGIGECTNPIKSGQCVIDGKCVAENDPNPAFPCQRCVPAVSTTSWTGGGDGPSCFIDDQCWPAGSGKEGEPCLRCRPDVSTTTWSPAAAADQIACDDGVACTQNDTCNGGACLGTAYTCDDSKQCTDNVCDGVGGCGYPVVTGQCLIDGTCYAQGARADAMTCRVCDDATPTAWSAPATAISCDDGDACTSADVCAGAACGGAAYECDDSSACTIDSCDGLGGCTNAPAANFCVIEAACFAGGSKNPANACQGCNTIATATAWTSFSAAEQVSCNDNKPCTQDDQCTAGLCLGEQYSCGDDRSCTDDVCDGQGGCTYPVKAGQCFIGDACYADGARPDATTCRVCDDATPTTWAAPDNGVSCDDANACSSGDVCAGATCDGVNYSCDDNAACTVDACNGTGAGDCTHTLSANSCLIGGVCYPNGASNPANSCLFCNTAVSPLFWSSKANGDACNDGDACSYGDRCSFGSCLAIPYDCIGEGCCVGDGTCTSTPPTGVVEQCQNGVDDDCDGVTDEGEPEVCADNTDNDCDGATDEAGNTWGEVFFARSWRTPATVAIYTSNFDGTFQTPKVLTFPAGRSLGIVGVGDFDADHFNDLVVAESVYNANDFIACGAGCATGTRCVGGGCVPYGCNPAADTCNAAHAGTQCLDSFELNDANAQEKFCYPPSRYYLARETCPSGIGLVELFSLPPGDGVSAIIDVNNDGHLDFVVRKHWATRRGYVMMNAGDAGNIQFNKVEYREDRTTPMLPMPGSAPGAPLVAPCSWVYNVSKTSKDVSGDGIVDLVGFCNPSGGSTPPVIWWWQGRGDGSFAPKQDLLNLAGTGTTPFALQTMNDFNRDGTQDIVGGMDDDGNSGTIWPILHRSAQSQNHWLAGSLAFDVMTTLFTADGPGAGGGTSGDFDRDGYADLLVGWAPNVPECQNVGAATCIYSEVAVLTNTTEDPCGLGTRCDGTACVACTRGDQVCDITWQCGTNACGDPCGAGCDANEICQGHTCVTREACVANCTGKTCGDNGCGGVCGLCADGQSCKAGACVTANDANCGTCVGQTCGSDDCGMPCVVFQNTYAIASDTNGRGGEAPTNAPPTAPGLRIQPTTPADSQDLICTLSVPSYDIDPVQYEYRWYRKPFGGSEAFVGAVSNRPVVPASLTSPNDQWRCEVIATDRLEYSQRVSSATVTINSIVSLPVDPADPR